MKKLTAKEVSNFLSERNIFVKDEFTFVEYVSELEKFQRAVAELVIGEEADEYTRLSDVISKLESEARKKDVINSDEIRRGIRGLNAVSKYIAVSKAGKYGENRVANTFQYVTRPDASFYRNVYLSNGEDETELDALVVTKNGFVIIEVKNAKEDITIAPDGRILFNNSTCYHDISIGDKMSKKRALLTERLKREFELKGIEKEVFVDSIIVFSTPYGTRVNVYDQFKRENYCFKGSLCSRIESFTSKKEYSDEELEQINEICKHIETEQKGFNPDINLHEISESFALAYEALSKGEEEANKLAVVRTETKPVVAKRTRKDIIISVLRTISGVAIAADVALFATAVFGGAFNSSK